ncbi:uncharacterized protein LOC143896643 [Temnothorax americanus]|uniref:uncharacterized protein LOC143896643 n=1 Tax=Temnothorax americanus TaxID=1964332 RepID=UPI0040689224
MASPRRNPKIPVIGYGAAKFATRGRYRAPPARRLARACGDRPRRTGRYAAARKPSRRPRVVEDANAGLDGGEGDVRLPHLLQVLFGSGDTFEEFVLAADHVALVETHGRLRLEEALPNSRLPAMIRLEGPKCSRARGSARKREAKYRERAQSLARRKRRSNY